MLKSKFRSLFNSTSGKFGLVLAFVMLAYGILNAVNGRFEMYDFKVYFDAAQKLFAGESPYGEAFGLSSGFFKYSIPALLILVPFCWMGWSIAKVLFFALISLTIVIVLPYMLEKARILFRFEKKKEWAAMILISILSIFHFSRELLLGNINWFLICLLFFSFLSMIKGKDLIAGLLFTIVLILKPHFAFLLPWFLWRMKWKLLLSSSVSMGILFLVPAIFLGWKRNIDLVKEWIGVMGSHNVDLASSPNTIYSWVRPVLIKIVGNPDSIVLIAIPLIVIGIGVLAYMLINDKLKLTAEKRTPLLYLEFMLICALVPNLVHTDTEHFMWSIPLFCFLCWNLIQTNVWKNWKWYVFVLCLIPLALATPDLWGRDIASWLTDSGVLGLANFILILIAIFDGRERMKNQIQLT